MKNFWKTNLNEAIKTVVEIPPGTFKMDWESFSNQMSQRLGVEGINIRLSKMRWVTPEEVEDNLGENLIYLSLALTPLNGHLFWAMDQDDISKITSWFLFKTSTAKGFSSEILQEGFYRYLILEGLDLIDQNPYLKGLSPKIISEEASLNDSTFSMDIEISYQERSCFGRIFVTKEFLSSWKETYTPSLDLLESPMYEKISVPINMLIGKTSLSLPSWENIQPGDFLVLDTVFFDLTTHNGTVILSVNEIPLFQAKIKPDKIKIVDFATINEESMDEPSEKTTLSLKDVPLSIHVEMGTFQIPVSRLMSLKPGEVIDLPVNAEEKVNLTLNGKTIATAELVKVGETYGVRIFETY